MLYVAGLAIPVFMIVLAVPMVLGAVPPNGWYGFRTPKTMSAPEIWYPANRAAGWYLIAAGAASIVLNAVLWGLHPEWPPERLVIWMTTAMTVLLLFGVAASFVYLSRL